MSELRLKLLNEAFSIHRLDPHRPIPTSVLGSSTFFVGRTPDELSIVAQSDVEVRHAQSEHEWACFMVEGPLDFNLTGIIARLSASLAEAEVPIFAISTFDTDYILVRQSDLPRAERALMKAGYQL
jgi:hypothetical protein